MYSWGTSVPALEPVLVSVKETVTTESWSLREKRSATAQGQLRDLARRGRSAAYQGSRAAPGPMGWRVPPAVEPLTWRFA